MTPARQVASRRKAARSGGCGTGGHGRADVAVHVTRAPGRRDAGRPRRADRGAIAPYRGRRGSAVPAVRTAAAAAPPGAVRRPDRAHRRGRRRRRRARVPRSPPRPRPCSSRPAARTAATAGGASSNSPTRSGWTPWPRCGRTPIRSACRARCGRCTCCGSGAAPQATRCAGCGAPVSRSRPADAVVAGVAEPGDSGAVQHVADSVLDGRLPRRLRGGPRAGGGVVPGRGRRPARAGRAGRARRTRSAAWPSATNGPRRT